MGYAIDAGLTGSSHAQLMHAKSAKWTSSVTKVSKDLGEGLGLFYLEKQVTPAVLTAASVCPARAISKYLRTDFEKHVVRAVRAEKEGGWWGELPNASRAGVVWETAQLPWDVQWRVLVVRMAAKLRRLAVTHPGTLAGAIAKAKVKQGQLDWVVPNRVLDKDGDEDHNDDAQTEKAQW